MIANEENKLALYNANRNVKRLKTKITQLQSRGSNFKFRTYVLPEKLPVAHDRIPTFPSESIYSRLVSQFLYIMIRWVILIKIFLPLFQNWFKQYKLLRLKSMEHQRKENRILLSQGNQIYFLCFLTNSAKSWCISLEEYYFQDFVSRGNKSNLPTSSRRNDPSTKSCKMSNSFPACNSYGEPSNVKNKLVSLYRFKSAHVFLDTQTVP